ncbi:unnamed protein product [Clonostachys rosea f. rosea IK726]|uniref:Uncharacterized protein n=1 Tax=Clonostachys rosea f. rosea IK726 TaxID=1349383 RepID=A0ACA9U471_BIOOC|nr:unnamed protein product [Clonostachys rosea f. rosea IK726]
MAGSWVCSGRSGAGSFQLHFKSALLNSSQQGGEGLGIIGEKTPELTAFYAFPSLPFGLKV